MSENICHKRFPIILNNRAVMVIHVFTRHDCIEDFWMSDCDHYSNYLRDVQGEAAYQLIEQLQGEWTPHFLMELRKAITKELEKHDKDFGTDFAQL